MPQLRSRFVAGVVLVQAAWLSLLLGRGWFSGPDLANISYAHGRALDADYLTASLGGHFGAPTRLLYWLLERGAPLGWGLTVGVRVALQALATVLLWRLLTELVGARRWIPVVLVLYAASAVLVPGLSVLSSGIGLEISQAAFLAMLLLHVRYTRRGRLRDALAVAVLALVALFYADQSAPGMLLLPVLSLGVLRTGPVLEQLRQRWAGWALLAAAAVVFAGLYVSGDYTGAATTFGLHDAWALARSEWVDVMGPSLVGGPWHWAPLPGQWSSDARPPLALKVLGQVALVGLVVASVRVTGRRALYGWVVPLLIAVGGLLLVGIGRFDQLGAYAVAILRYSHFTPMAMALGITLAFAAAPEEQVEERPLALPEGSRAVAAVALVGALVMSVVSAAGFAERFWRNTSPDYVANLTATARTSTQQFFDPPVPASVIPPVEPNHFVSDVLALTGERLRFEGLQAAPLTIDAAGKAVPAGFVPATDLTDPTTPGCGVLVTRTTTLHLGSLYANPWDLQLQIVQNRSNAFRVEVRDVEGRVMPFRHGSASVQPSGRLVAVNRALPYGIPSTVTLVVEGSSTSLCLVHAFVGSPFPR
jgi:hypothetical protein